MGFAVVAMSPLLEAPAPIPVLKSRPILVKAGTEKVTCFPILEEV